MFTADPDLHCNKEAGADASATVLGRRPLVTEIRGTKIIRDKEPTGKETEPGGPGSVSCMRGF